MASSIPGSMAQAGPVSVPSASSLTLVPLLFLAGSLWFDQWTARAVSIRDALKRYDAQPAVRDATKDNTKDTDAQDIDAQDRGQQEDLPPHWFVISFITIPTLLVFLSCLGLVGLTCSKEDIWQAVREHGMAIAGGFVCVLMPWCLELGINRPSTLEVGRDVKSRGKSSTADEGATRVYAGKYQAESDINENSRYWQMLALLKMFVAGYLSAKTGMLMPILFWVTSNSLNRAHGRSLRRGFLVVVMSCAAIIGFGVLAKKNPAASKQALDSTFATNQQDKFADGCDFQAGDCSVKNKPPSLPAWIFTMSYSACLYITIVPIVVALIAIRNFDLLAAEKGATFTMDLQPDLLSQDAITGAIGQPQFKVTTSIVKRDGNGKIPERVLLQHERAAHSDRASRLPTYTAAVRAFQAFLATGILGLLAVAIASLDDNMEVRKGTFPTYLHPMTLQGLLLDPNVMDRESARVSLLVLACLWGLASYAVVLLAASFSAFRRSGWSGLCQLWTATDPIWSEGPIVFAEEELVSIKAA
ncbi:hypothetical protein CF327_g3766 [Tilletia walkeri]|nr:hypothetical protein CF327_g3766 [Tilletia walkeri]